MAAPRRMRQLIAFAPPPRLAWCASGAQKIGATMSTQDTFALYEDLHVRKEEPAWRLLATLQSPAICTCLHVLFATERSLPSSAFHERLHRQLEIVRRAGAIQQPSAHTHGSPA